VRQQRAASKIRLAAGGFDHGSHSLHHGGTTSMAVDPDLGPTRLDLGATVLFLFLKIGLSYRLGTTDT
jgi:hypothetical protein